MKKDLKDCTFIIPIRIESTDRLRNVITILCYLNSNFDTNIIVKEVDKESILISLDYHKSKNIVEIYHLSIIFLNSLTILSF
ncbi:MAG: hypothetical protein CM15mV20_2220 [uncultured marine virus]|nr:MAG: hypothetical protein CM15mV20_2220 [uncultured marine virus]